MKKTLKVMDSTGDSRFEFEASVDSPEASEARLMFEKLMYKGAAVFAVNRADGQPDKRVNNFDELEAENVAVPRIAGG